MSTSPLSVQLYTVRDALSVSIPDTLNRLAEMGFTNVELYDFLDKTDQYREALSNAGLTALSCHALLVDKPLKPIFEAARSLSIPTVIDPDIDRSRWSNREDVVANAMSLNAVARQAADFELAVGYHNHSWELTNTIDGTTALEVFADHLLDEVVLEVDTYWVEHAGISAANLLARLGERVKFLHIKDGFTSDDPDLQVGLGRGRVDINGILAARGDAISIVELDDSTGDIFDELQASIDFLRYSG